MVRYVKGLSQNTVHATIQDSYGFLWFGTWDGLNKYDGYTFTVWNEENGLSNQTISALIEDKDGLIWIGTEDGLNVYDRSTDEITIYRHDHREPYSLVHNTIRCLELDDEGNIWIGTNRGISVFIKEQNHFINYRHDVSKSSSLINNWINDILCDHYGNIWIATYKGLEKFDPATNGFLHFNRSTGWDTLAMIPVFCLEQSLKPDDYIWLGTENGLFKIDHKKKRFFHYFGRNIQGKTLPDNSISDLLFDDNGNLWIGTTGGGVVLMNRDHVFFKTLQNRKDDLQSLSNNHIYSIFEDDAGIIWIGTYSGLNKYDKHSSKFRHHKQNPDDPESLLSDIIFCFHEIDNGNILIGSEDGVNIFDPVEGNFSLFKDSKNNKTRLAAPIVRAIYQDDDGIIWIGSRSGLTKFNPVTKEIKVFRAEPGTRTSLPGNYILKIIEDEKGFLWMSTDRGIARFNRKNESFINYTPSESNPFSLPNRTIFDIYNDKRDKLWVATAGGLFWLDKRSHRFYPAIKGMDDALTANQLRASSVFEDKNGVFWVGSFGGGLMRFHPDKEKYMFFTDNDGLPNNVVYNVVDDLDGNLWVPTNRGLARFNVVNESFITYTTKDGLQSNEFNLGASLRTSNGRLLFGGMNGFNSFFPHEIRKNVKPPRIAVSGFYVFDQLVKRELFDRDTVKLKYSENFFAFIFTALDYANPAKNQYKYYLENFEKDWNSTDAYDRVAEYTNVPPGRYTFRVIGSNNDGIWNEEGIAITLIITPPWYATWVFRGGMITSFAVFIYMIVTSRIRRIKRKHLFEKQFLEMEKQYFDLEQKALRLQMNPHFIFNTLNSIQSYMVKNDTETAIEYLAKFARLIRKVLINSREAFIPIKEEIAALNYYLEIEQLRFDDKFSYTINISSDIDEEFTGIPPMIIQPYVENAIIHGIMYKKGKGRVDISMVQKNEHIFCVIEDDGVGREKALQMARDSGIERKSTGMLITQQRLDILNKNNDEELKVNVIDKRNNEGIPCGTRVEIKIPFIDI